MNVHANSDSASHVPLCDYLARIASLPLPTDQQIKDFCRYVTNDHSWYKGSLLTGARFVFYLSPDLGPDQQGDCPLNRVSNNTSQGYLDRFGYLHYQHHTNLLGLRRRPWPFPLELERVSATDIYPYLSRSRIDDIVWTVNKELLPMLETIDHPDKELLVAWRDSYIDKQALYHQGRALFSNENFPIFWHKRMAHAFRAAGLRWSREGEMQGTDASIGVDLAELEAWGNKIDAAFSKEGNLYRMLHEIETAKILAALFRLRVWIDEMRDKTIFPA